MMCLQFAFHSVMLRDTLSELNYAGSVEVVQKVSEIVASGVSN